MLSLERRTALLIRLERPLFSVLLAALFALGMFSPYIVKGTGASLLVNNNLEMLDQFGPLVDGAPASSSWYLTHALWHSLGVFWGSVANEVLSRSVAFAGAWLLGWRLAQAQPRSVLLTTLLACAFAAVPFWPLGDFAVSGIPIALWALLNLRDHVHRLTSCLLLAAFAYHSDPWLTGAPLIALTSAWLLWEAARRRRGWWLLLGIAILVGVYALTRSVLFPPTGTTALLNTTRTTEDVRDAFLETIVRITRIFTSTPYLASANQGAIILPSGIACAAFLLGTQRWQTRSLVLVFLGFCLFAGSWWALEFSRYLAPGSSALACIESVRWHLMLPGLWYVVWGALLIDTWRASENRARASLVLAGLLCLQIAVNASETAVRNMFARPTFAEFVSTKLFSTIRKRLDLRSGERAGCVGFHSAAARYNEIPTIGSASLPADPETKKLVAGIIQVALRRRPKLLDQFQREQSPVYLYDDEIGTDITDQRKLHKDLVAITPDYDISLLKAARVKYLLSAVPFKAPEKHGYDHVFTGASDYYRISVYRIR